MPRNTIFFHRKRKSRNQIIWTIRRKKKKNKHEKIITEMYNSYFFISEICVEASKGHITEYNALEKIRNILSKCRSFN
jgi:hypothetical protein